LWQKHTHACIEIIALLVCCANATLAWFEGILKLLGEIGSSEKIWEQSLAGTDELFVMRWTCLSLLVIRPILADNRNVQIRTRETMKWFARANDTGNESALAGAQQIDETLQKAERCLFRLYEATFKTEEMREEVNEIQESQISELEQINIKADRLEGVDHALQYIINSHSHQIISQFPGVLNDFDVDFRAPIPFSRIVKLSRNLRKLQFICPWQTLKSMCSPAPTLCNILEGQGDADTYKELLKNLRIFYFFPSWQ
jgi:hypothetical protein